MPASTVYPAADARNQWFADAWPGGIMPLTAPVLVLHSTEGYGWPGYQGGAVAPTFTIWPGVGVRQHFPVNMGARALMNQPGGVETNGAGAIQVEMVGTCVQGGPGIYYPNATDGQLSELAALTRWLRDSWGLKVQSTVRWVPYPQSYGFNAAQRLSGAAWTAYEGILGHQHVPENDHGDPGAFPIQRLLALTTQEDTLTIDDIKTAVREGVTAVLDTANLVSVGGAKWTVTHVLDWLRRGVAQHGTQLAGLQAAVDALGAKAGVDVQAIYDAAAKGAAEGVQAEITGAQVQVSLTAGA